MSQERVLETLRKHGYNSSSFNILTEGKKYFFSEGGTEGVIAYADIADVFIAAGDAVCSDQDVMQFVHEFRKFCKKEGKDCCFQAISKKFRDVLDLMGFGYIKIGEEPFFDLSVWNTAGSRFEGLRNEINHARRIGFMVKEYEPLKSRNEKYERQMMELSKQWLKERKSGEFSFLVGSPSLEDPGERKYFIVLNPEDDVEAFLVCVPIFARNGLYFDIMRRKEKPEKGTTELLITEAFRTMREQGYSVATLGSAPLADITKEEEKNRLIQKSLEFAYNNLNYFYHFKPLLRYKQKFGPTTWESKYFAYYPPGFKVKYIYAILKAYDPGGISEMVLSNIRAFWKKIREAGSI